MEILTERTDNGFNLQINKFASKIDEDGEDLGLTPAEIQAVKDDAVATNYVYGNQITVKQFFQQHSAFKKIFSHGRGNLGNMPVPPVFGVAPAVIRKDVVGHFRSLTARISRHPNFTKAIGEKLGIVAPETPFDPSKGKPKFEVEFDSVGHPILIWHKGDYHGVEIWKDSGSGYAKLDRDNMPDYIDKSALPALGESVTWKYKMVYIYKDEQAGKFSDEQVISVHGIL